MHRKTITTHEHKRPSLDHIRQSLGQRKAANGWKYDWTQTANWHQAYHIS